MSYIFPFIRSTCDTLDILEEGTHTDNDAVTLAPYLPLKEGILVECLF